MANIDFDERLDALLEGLHVNLIHDDSWQHLPVFFANGKLRPMPYAFWKSMSFNTRRLFLHYHAQYFLPTLESILFIDRLISDVPKKDCLEIGAGNGWLGFLLGIRMTDNYNQTKPEIKQMYDNAGQPVIKYGADVEKIEAVDAAKKYLPHTIIGSWITEKGEPPYGNPYAIDEVEMMRYCKRYVFIGTDIEHRYKTLIRNASGQKYKCPGLISRTKDDDKNTIWVFEK